MGKDRTYTSTWKSDLVSAVQTRIDELATLERLATLEKEFRCKYRDPFADELPHVSELLDDSHYEFRLTDAFKVIEARSYSSPWKYREAWER